MIKSEFYIYITIKFAMFLMFHNLLNALYGKFIMKSVKYIIYYIIFIILPHIPLRKIP